MLVTVLKLAKRQIGRFTKGFVKRFELDKYVAEPNEIDLYWRFI